MSRRGVRAAFAAIVVAAALARAAALAWAPPHHPDQFFQYLEPAWGRLTGAGVETWEWIAGVRSWVLPGYHGAWMALLRRLGFAGPTIGFLMQAHWAALSLFLVGAGWRGGSLIARRSLARPFGAAAGPRTMRSPGDAATFPPSVATAPAAAPAGWQGGLLGALLCALFPWLVLFSIQTLSELASSLCFVWGLVLVGEVVEGTPVPVAAARRAPCWDGTAGRAAWAGFWLSLATCLRIQHGPLVLVAVGWLLWSGRRDAFRPLLAGALVPVAIFGVVDRLTWGRFFASFVEYIDFNFIKQGASHFGTSSAAFYWQGFQHRLPVALPILALTALVGARAAWPFTGAALLLVGLLGTQAHKEERFVVLFWPLLLISAAGVAGGWLARRTAGADDATAAVAASAAAEGAPTTGRSASAPGRRQRVAARAAVALAVVVILADGARHAGGTEFDLSLGRFRGQAWVGRQADATGLLYDEPLYTGGYLWLGRTIPQVQFSVPLLENPLFTHVLVPVGSEAARQAMAAGFAPVHEEDGFLILARRR